MKPAKRNWWKLACVLYLLYCVLIDLFPHYGAPHFRYPGSATTIHVRNLGWPLAISLLRIQFILFGVTAVLYSMRKKKLNNTSEHVQ